jgi:hypothetical protein
MLKQQSLPIPPFVHPDRNAALGGKSFYFFDMDENILHIDSAHFVFHKVTKERKEITGRIFTQELDNIGVRGFLKDFEILPDDMQGSFQRFRDLPQVKIEEQPLLLDLEKALAAGEWMGPSWNQFHHAVLNQRPVAIITARGHLPETIKSGLSILKTRGLLPSDPNYLTVLPVSHPEISPLLGGGTVPELKRKAIRYAVEMAFKTYGYSDHHRFGMSDDDPKNVQKIIEEFILLKKDYPKVSFFIIETTHGRANKWEIFNDHAESTLIEPDQQLALL